MVECPHCAFHCSIDVLVTNLRWHCLKCECMFEGDGAMTYIGGRAELCSFVRDRVLNRVLNKCRQI